jgi:uncharacterized protein
MTVDYPIVDADTHYAENLSRLYEYIDEPWRRRLKGDRLRRYLPASLGDRDMHGLIDPDRRMGDTGQSSDEEVRDRILGDMKELGLDAIMMVPNALAMISHMSVRDLAVALCNAHIDYHLDRVVDPARGIYTMPIVTWHDPIAAAEMVQRVADHPAVVGVALMTAYSNPPWGDVRYHPLYEVAERHNLPIVVHAASSGTLMERATIQDGLQRLIEAHQLAFLVSNQIQLTSMIAQGIPVRYPKLKVVFLETGVFWAAAMMYRLDAYYVKRRSEAPLLEDLPSEYIKRHFWFGTQPIEAPADERALEAVFDTCHGRDQFLFASDYPHWDFDHPTVVDRLRFLSSEDKAKIYAGNALGVFNFAKGGVQPWHSNVLDRLKSYSVRPTETPGIAALS